ncbi:disease resistance protein RGA1 [Pyrus ussuriensis x Pyrus communis]|uniref:Disease resistance protein RGA1 n=1 Tax=Pyrus ussuriensis x Pyrus communis TaxID=2448454 RepID=A0A5N5HVF2_9ROSA|nr:disease resistance protein RGA1 [Pyrus ussuriensis x Pyrus communis]
MILTTVASITLHISYQAEWGCTYIWDFGGCIEDLVPLYTTKQLLAIKGN